jgi:hypothetical protein
MIIIITIIITVIMMKIKTIIITIMIIMITTMTIVTTAVKLVAILQNGRMFHRRISKSTHRVMMMLLQL